MKNQKILTKLVALAITAFAVATFTVVTGAIQFSETNVGIDIITGEYTGYRFFGPDSPHSPIDTTEIAAVKFYIKFDDLEHHEPAMVNLSYNSGTTAWVSVDHDLNDGLIVEIDITPGGVSLDDFFEVALFTDNPAIQGTFSVEIRDHDGEVLGEGVYGDNIPDSNEYHYNSHGEGEVEDEGVPEETEESEETTATTTEAPVTGSTEVPPSTTPATSEPPPAETNPPTGNANIITATAMTIVSALAILSMKKGSSRKSGK
ncbi:MAG: hypothetical protein FWF76_05855 [Oscillospiraceae bacterium]|nr:hypothetical protein [Oscillospiraceae bacterium]